MRMKKEGLAEWIELIQNMHKTEIQKLEIVNWNHEDENFKGRVKLTTKDGEILVMKLELNVIEKS